MVEKKDVLLWLDRAFKAAERADWADMDFCCRQATEKAAQLCAAQVEEASRASQKAK